MYCLLISPILLGLNSPRDHPELSTFSLITSHKSGCYLINVGTGYQNIDVDNSGWSPKAEDTSPLQLLSVSQPTDRPLIYPYGNRSGNGSENISARLKGLPLVLNDILYLFHPLTFVI